MKLKFPIEVQDRLTEEYIQVEIKGNYIPPSGECGYWFNDEIENVTVIFPDGLEMELDWVLNNYNDVTMNRVLDRANYYWTLSC
jgi:hypothetical protein